MGATLEAWPVEACQPDPVFSTFVLTVSDASEKVCIFDNIHIVLRLKYKILWIHFVYN